MLLTEHREKLVVVADARSTVEVISNRRGYGGADTDPALLIWQFALDLHAPPFAVEIVCLDSEISRDDVRRITTKPMKF